MNVSAQPSPILTVEDLCIDARTPEGLRPVLEGVSFALAPGETLCLAGESGSGKSLTALSIMRLLSPSLRVRSGSVTLAGRELTALPERAMRLLRGGDVAMIFQEPMTSLNPVMTIGAQLTEAIRTHGGSAVGGRACGRALGSRRSVHRPPSLARHPAPSSLPRPAPAPCSMPCTSPNRRGAWRNIRTSSRAACGSA